MGDTSGTPAGFVTSSTVISYAVPKSSSRLMLLPKWGCHANTATCLSHPQPCQFKHISEAFAFSVCNYLGENKWKTEEQMRREDAGKGSRKGEDEQIKRESEEGGGKREEDENPPPLMALNHASWLCRNVEASIDFYVNVLGFVLVKRPQALDFNGAWSFNYGVGIHLVQKEEQGELPDREHLDPMDNHISFQCEDLDAIERKLKETNIKYTKRTVKEENGRDIDQLFFKDPDGYMIEVCNCEDLKLVPAGSLGRIRLSEDQRNPPIQLDETEKAKRD